MENFFIINLLKIEGKYESDVINFKDCFLIFEHNKLQTVQFPNHRAIFNSHIPKEKCKFDIEPLPSNKKSVPIGTNYTIEYFNKSDELQKIYVKLDRITLFRLNWMLKKYRVQSDSILNSILTYILIAIISFIIGSFYNPFKNNETDKSSIINRIDSTALIKTEKQIIKSTLIDMWDAIEKGDIDRYASYIHKDFTQFGETDSVLRSGKVAEIKGIKDWIESSSPIHTEMHKPKVTINGNTAFIIYYWSDSGTTNGKPFATRGKSTRIFVKENGKWLCIHGHYTLLPD